MKAAFPKLYPTASKWGEYSPSSSSVRLSIHLPLSTLFLYSCTAVYCFIYTLHYSSDHHSSYIKYLFYSSIFLGSHKLHISDASSKDSSRPAEVLQTS
jgi:hypothetical protein